MLGVVVGVASAVKERVVVGVAERVAGGVPVVVGVVVKGGVSVVVLLLVPVPVPTALFVPEGLFVDAGELV